MVHGYDADCLAYCLLHIRVRYVSERCGGVEERRSEMESENVPRSGASPGSSAASSYYGCVATGVSIHLPTSDTQVAGTH